MNNFHVEIIKSYNPNETQIPVLSGEVTLERKLNSSPATLTFTCIKDDILSFSMGDYVRFIVDGEPAFFGRVFKKSRQSDGKIDVTAYDSLRYLMNEDTIVLGQDNGKSNFYTIQDLVLKIARKQILRIIEDGDKIVTNTPMYDVTFDDLTSCLDSSTVNYSFMDPVVYEDKSYLDMILDTFDKMRKKWDYRLVIYDYNGLIKIRKIDDLVIEYVDWIDPDKDAFQTYSQQTRLMPRSYENLKSGDVFSYDHDQVWLKTAIDLYKRFGIRVERSLTTKENAFSILDNLLDEETKNEWRKSFTNTQKYFISTNTIEDFSHDETIDEDFCTEVRLIKGEGNNLSNVYSKRTIDADGLQYGQIVHYEKVDNDVNMKTYAEEILRQKSKPKCMFSVDGVVGHIGIRGGSGIRVKSIDVGKEIYNGLMLVESATHHFQANSHTMDLKLVTHPNNNKIERVE